eukprot:gene36237-43958_t
MENKDVRSVLDALNINLWNDVSTEYGSTVASVADRNETITRLMNVTLHCLGAIRKLVIENEKVRVGLDITDLNGSTSDSGDVSLIQRQIFASATKTMVDTIVSGKELLPSDPMKDLVDSFPWSHTFQSPYWLMLDWALMTKYIDGNTDDQVIMETSRDVLKYFPDCLSEVDKMGHHYMTYAIRSQSTDLLKQMLYYHPDGHKIADGKGRRAIHYAAAYSQSVETLLILSNNKRSALAHMLLNTLDDYGNTPLHLAASGHSSITVLKEILFACPDAIRVRNNDGMLPLHIAAGKGSLENVQALVSAFPNAINVTDKNHWLPIHHAAYDNRSVDVVKYLCEAFPDPLRKPQSSSGRLPLHFAAVKCLSSKVMKYLLDAYPDAAQTFDCHRRLPLHNLIARCDYVTPARLRCLRLLLDAYPHAASMRDNDGRTPYHLAKRDNHGPLVLRLLLRADPGQNPEELAELTYLAAKAKYREDGEEEFEEVP